MLKPQQQVPDLTVKTVGGSDWTLSGQSPENFTFLFFYRGYHCPICRKYLGSIDRKLDELSSMGIHAVLKANRLRKKVVGALFHGLHRRLDCAVASQHNDL